MRAVIAVLLAGALCLVLLTPGARTLEPSTRPTRAQAAATVQTSGIISATLYGSAIDWHGEPGDLVGATVLEDGFAVAYTSSRSIADQGGVARLSLSRAQNCAVCSRHGGPIRPDSRVVVYVHDGSVVTATIPSLAGDLDFDRELIAGIAPPNSQVELALFGQEGEIRIARKLSVDSEGRFLIDLGLEGIDVTSRDRAEVVLVDVDGHRFRADIVAPMVLLEWDRRIGCAWHRDDLLNVVVQGADGQLKESGCQGRESPTPAPGDIVTLERGTGFLVPGAVSSVRLVVPELEAAFDILGQSLIGQGPPAETLQVRLSTGVRAPWDVDVMTDASGAFQAAVPADPGLEAELLYDGGNGIRLKAISVDRMVFVGLQNAVVAVRLPRYGGDGAYLSLSDPAGDVKADLYLQRDWEEVPWSGMWSDAEADENAVAPQPGDGLTLDFGDAALIEVVVPEITAEVDATNDVIEGTAPAGVKLQITFAGEWALHPTRPPIDIIVDADGRYRADLQGSVDIVPGMWGLVVERPAAGPVAFYTVWDAAQLKLNLTTGLLDGTGRVDERVRCQVHRADGSPLLDTTVRNPWLLSLSYQWPNRPRWTVFLTEDMEQASNDVATGDVIAVESDSSQTQLIVPPLDVNASAATDEVWGMTTPGTTVTIRIAAPVDQPLRVGMGLEDSVVAAADGSYRLRLADRFDLRGGDEVRVTLTTPEGHVVSRFVQTPKVIIDLNNGWITGGYIERRPAAPETVTAALTRQGVPVAGVISEAAVAGHGSSFFVPLRDANGNPVPPRDGDQLILRIGTPDPQVLEMRVPGLDAVMDWDQARLRGRVTSPGLLEVHLGAGTILYPARDGDGAFDLRLAIPGAVGPFAVPGRTAGLRLYLPTGDIVQRRFVYPSMSVELGGARVDGLLEPLAEAHIEVRDAQGSLRATGSARAKEYSTEGYDGDATSNFTAIVTDASGAVKIESGDRVRMVVGGLTVEVTVPEIRLDVDWENGRLDGQGPADGQSAWAVQGDRSCGPYPGFSWASLRDLRRWSTYPPLMNDQLGGFSFEPFDVQPGKRFLIGALVDGHRVYRTVARASAAIDAERGVVEGCSQPLEMVTASIHDEDGEARAQAEVVADATGRYQVRLQPADGGSAPIQPTDSVTICAIGDCAVLNAQPAGVALSDGMIHGEGQAGQPAFLTLVPRYPFVARPQYPQLEGPTKSRWYPLVRQIALDEGGQFELLDAEIAAWERYWPLPWKIADLEALRLWSQVEAGRYFISDWPRQESTRIFMPLASKPR